MDDIYQDEIVFYRICRTTWKIIINFIPSWVPI